MADFLGEDFVRLHGVVKVEDDDENDALRFDENENSLAVADGEIHLKVSEYYIVGDGSSYEKHFFIIEVRVENLQFTIDRSYVDFVELDRRIRKLFPQTLLPEINLNAAKWIAKILTERSHSNSHLPGQLRKLAAPRDAAGANGNNMRLSIVGATRESLSGGTLDFNKSSGQQFKIKEKYKDSESIPERMNDLNEYLQLLLLHHELITCDDFLMFLDEEISSMLENDPKEPLSTHDLLLLNEVEHKCLVTRSEEYCVNLLPNQLVVWRFRTARFDIGFSVEMNGELRVPYQRYKAHESAICGTLEASKGPKTSICLLKWDNSYSKFRVKSLAWSMRVVSAEEYHSAKAQALECQREKKKFELQRFAVSRVAVRRAAKLSGGVIHGSSVLPEHAQEETLHMRDLESEVALLQDDNASLQNQVDELKQQLSYERSVRESSEQSMDMITESWKFSVKQLEDAQAELKTAKASLSAKTELSKKLQMENAALQDMMVFNKKALGITTEHMHKFSSFLHNLNADVQEKTKENKGIFDQRMEEKRTRLEWFKQNLSILVENFESVALSGSSAGNIDGGNRDSREKYVGDIASALDDGASLLSPTDKSKLLALVGQMVTFAAKLISETKTVQSVADENTEIIMQSIIDNLASTQLSQQQALQHQHQQQQQQLKSPKRNSVGGTEAEFRRSSVS